MGCGKSRVSIEENNTNQLINNYNKNNDVMVNRSARFLVNDGINHVTISPISNEIMKNVYEPKTLYFAFQKCKYWGNVDWCTVVKKSEEEKLIQKMDNMELIDIEQVILDPPQITAFSNESFTNDIKENSNDVNNNYQDINHVFELDFNSEPSESENNTDDDETIIVDMGIENSDYNVQENSSLIKKSATTSKFKIANSKAIFSLCKSMLYQTNQKMKQIGLPDQQPDLILEDYFYLDRFLLAY